MHAPACSALFVGDPQRPRPVIAQAGVGFESLAAGDRQHGAAATGGMNSQIYIVGPATPARPGHGHRAVSRGGDCWIPRIAQAIAQPNGIAPGSITPEARMDHRPIVSPTLPGERQRAVARHHQRR